MNNNELRKKAIKALNDLGVDIKGRSYLTRSEKTALCGPAPRCLYKNCSDAKMDADWRINRLMDEFNSKENGFKVYSVHYYEGNCMHFSVTYIIIDEDTKLEYELKFCPVCRYLTEINR